MDLGNAVLKLVVDESGLESGLKSAKETTETYGEESQGQADGFKGAWETAMAAVAAAGILLAVEGFKKIIAAGKEMLDEFAQDERALVTLTFALESNKTATKETAGALHDWAEEMEKTTIFSNDQIETNAALLAGMGMTEDRIKEVMSAAMGLSSVYGVDLDQAVRGLASSLESGTTGMLSRYIPSLRTFTEEQLRHGAAVTWAAEQYPGAAELIGTTTEGLQARMTSLIDGQKAKIGEVIAAAYSGVEKSRDTIEMIGTVAAGIVDVLIKSTQSLGSWMKSQYAIFFDFFKLVGQLVVDVAKVLWEPISIAFPGVMETVKKGFVNALNWVLDQSETVIKKIGDGLSKFTGGVLGRAMQSVDLGHIEYVVGKLATPGTALNTLLVNAKNNAEALGQAAVASVENIYAIWAAKGPSVATTIANVQKNSDDLTGSLRNMAEQTVVASDDALLWATIEAGAMRDIGQAGSDLYAQLEAAETDRIDQLAGDAELWASIEAGAMREIGQNGTDLYETLNVQRQEDLDKARKAAEEKADAEKKMWDLISGWAISASRSIFEAIGSDLAQGTLTWQSFGEAALHAIGRIVSAIGDQLAASAAADVILALAAAASIIGLPAAPGYAASAAIKTGGAVAAWATGGALQSIKLSEGGDFIVPPGFPDDSFPMRAESGEHVTVTPAGESDSGGPMIHVVAQVNQDVLFDIITRGSRNGKILTRARSVVP